MEPLLQLHPGRSERDALAAAVVRVALTTDQAALFDRVEIADQMAPVEAEPVGEVVLGERAEVGEPGQHREVRQPQIVFGERVDQQEVTDPGDMARQSPP